MCQYLLKNFKADKCNFLSSSIKKNGHEMTKIDFSTQEQKGYLIHNVIFFQSI